MKTLALLISLLLCIGAFAQTSVWDLRPMQSDMPPCQDGGVYTIGSAYNWIAPGDCGGCSACRQSVDSDESLMDGEPFLWSSDVEVCAHAIDSTSNYLSTFGWGETASDNTVFLCTAMIYGNVHYDALQVICGAAAGENVQISIRHNNEAAIVVFDGPVAIMDTITVGDLGCSELLSGQEVFSIYIRAYGSTGELMLKQVQLIGSSCTATSIPDNRPQMNQNSVGTYDILGRRNVPSDPGLRIMTGGKLFIK